jgi:hypothetical protein
MLDELLRKFISYFIVGGKISSVGVGEMLC